MKMDAINEDAQMSDQFTELGYLGDGVYLSYDGWQYWLAVNHHENRVVALEPMVAQLLVNALQKHMTRGLQALKDPDEG